MIDIRKTIIVNGQAISGLLCENFSSVDEAVKRASDIKSENPDAALEVVELNDEIDGDDWCGIRRVLCAV